MILPAQARPIRHGVPHVLADPKPASEFWGPRLALLATVLTAIGFFAGFSVSVTLLTTMGFVAALAGIARPAVGLLGVGILSTIDPLTRVYLMTGGLFRWNSFNYVLLLMLLLFYQRVLRLRDTASMLLMGFTFLLIAQLTFTPDISVGMYNVLNVVAAFGLLLYHLRCGRDRRILMWLAVVNGLVAGLGGLIYFIQIEQLPLMNKNAWSAFPLTALFSICLAFPYASEGWRGKGVLGLLAFVNSIWIFFSGSRGGMLISVFCLFFLLFYMHGFMRKLQAAVVAVAATLAVFSMFGQQQEFALHRIEKLFDTSRALDSRTSGRSDLAMAGWYIFRENPLGVGTGGYGVAYANLLDNNLAFIGEEKMAHSAWVKTLAENGVIGIVIFTAYVGCFAVIGFRRREWGFFPLGILVTLVIASAFFSREFQSKGIWLIAAGFISVAEYGLLAGAPAIAAQRDALRRYAGRQRQQQARAPRRPSPFSRPAARPGDAAI